MTNFVRSFDILTLRQLLIKINLTTEKVDVMPPEVEEQISNITSDIESLLDLLEDEESDAGNIKDQELILVKSVFELTEIVSVLPTSKVWDTYSF